MKAIFRAIPMAVLVAFAVLSLATNLLNMLPVANAAVTRPLTGSETKDWASLADGAGASEDVSVPGAILGDFCIGSMGVDVVDVVFTCNVTATGVATVRMQNETTGAVDLASSTLRVQVIKSSQY